MNKIIASNPKIDISKIPQSMIVSTVMEQMPEAPHSEATEDEAILTPLLKSAEIFMNNKDFSKAHELYRNGVSKFPKSYILWLKLGITYVLIKNYALAVFAFNKSLKIKPDDYEAYYNLGFSYFAQNNLTAAEAAYVESIYANSTNKNNNNASCLANLGAIHLLENNHKQSLQYIKEALKLDPDNFSAKANLRSIANLVANLRFLGESAYSEERYPDAIILYIKAINIDPENVAIWKDLANAYCLNEENEKAIICCKKAIALDPANSGTYNDLGKILLNQGNIEAACSALLTSIKFDPNNAATWHNLGIANIELNNFDVALIALKKAIKLNPENDELYFASGIYYLKAGNKLGALNCFRESFNLNPLNYEITHIIKLIESIPEDEVSSRFIIKFGNGVFDIYI